MTARLAFAFFCSGFAALLCQIVWQRLLGIFAGSDTISAALVVGAFLCGLGLGSLLGARYADRLGPRRALLGFAIAESLVALFALISKFFLYDFLAIGLAGTVDEPAAIFALCFIGLVLPTTLMGASLPLLSRAIATSLDTVAEKVAKLYGLNTLGAGLGALLGGWLLVGNIGFVGALILAAVLDFAAAGIALSLLKRLPETIPIAQKADDKPKQGIPEWGGLKLWCLLVFLSGYVIVALEIVWVRLFGQVGQYHAYLFPTVLGIFLLADGAGMALAARMTTRIRDPRPAFFLTQSFGFLLAALLILVLWLLVPVAPLDGLLQVDHSRLGGAALALNLLLVLLVVGPPAFVIGMTFPFVQRAVQRDLADVGARVGWVQLANIAGNAAGSVGTGLLSLHILGTAGSLVALAMLSLLLLLFWLPRANRRQLGVRVGWAAALGCLLVGLVLPDNDTFWNRLHKRNPDHVVAWSEDRSGVAYFRGLPQGSDAQGGDSQGFPMFIQGFSQGRIPFLPIHQFLGAVGPLLHPDPKRVLAVGVGSGGTPWAAGISPATESVRAIELVGPVLDVLENYADAFPGSAIHRMLEDPRYTLEYGDGRRLLAREATLYDVIQADAILPEGSHSGLLYSREFLQQVRQRLAPGGLYVQWAPTRRVAETFASVFPHVLLLLPSSVLVGSNDPIAFEAAELARRLAMPQSIAHLTLGNPHVQDYGAMFAEAPLIWTPDMPRGKAPLSDLFPRDEFYLNNKIEGAHSLRRAPL
ncbi:fused MFS/spermidine synthase [Ferrovibrio sp.]|uniref:fused MFS/spermidine synthase n=1 Tax=Ferrovibrio sp. TaxID=1917215 RepID=UPI0035B42263